MPSILFHFSTSNRAEWWKKWNERKNNQTKNKCFLLKSKSSNHGKFYCRRNICAGTAAAAVTIFAIVVDVFFVVCICWRLHCIYIYVKIDRLDCSWIAGILQWFESSNTRNHFRAVLCINVAQNACAYVFGRVFPMFWIFPF